MNTVCDWARERPDAALIEVNEDDESMYFDINVGPDPAVMEHDLLRADEWLRYRYGMPKAQPMSLITCILLDALVRWAEDEGAVPAVPSLGALATSLGVSLDVVTRMSDLRYAEGEGGGAMQHALAVARIAGFPV